MDTTVKIDARDVNFWYGDFHALKAVSYTHLTLPTKLEV